MPCFDDFYSGGYYLVKPVMAEHLNPFPFFPQPFLTLSTCFSKKLQLEWGWNKDSENALAFGISESLLDEFWDWCGNAQADEVDFYTQFQSVEAGQAFVKKFISQPNDLLLVGAAFPKTQLEACLANYGRVNSVDPTLHGLHKHLDLRLPINPNGQILGYELLSTFYGFEHSWTCFGWVGDLCHQFKIHLNQWGLIDTYEPARAIFDWFQLDDNGNFYDWDVWGLVAYPTYADHVLYPDGFDRMTLPILNP